MVMRLGLYTVLEGRFVQPFILTAIFTLRVYCASEEIRKATTSFVYEQRKTLRTRSAELTVALNTPKTSGLSPALF